MRMSSRKEEVEPLIPQSENAGSHFESHECQDGDSEYNRARNTSVQIPRSAVQRDYLAQGEHRDPLQEREHENSTSNCDTMIHLLKANVGTGILAMSQGFKHAGLMVGTLCTLLLAFVCVHTMHELVHCAHEICRRTHTPSVTFPELAEISFKLGPPSFRRFSSAARILINVFLCVTQLGFCCVYVVFVAENLSRVINPYFGLQWNTKAYMAILLLPLILMNWIRNLKLLAPFSMIANIFMGFGLGIIFYYIFKEPLPPMRSRDYVADWSELPLYFGTAIYAFEGIGMILPLENKMKTPHDFIGWNGVLNTSMVIVSCVYIGIGFFGYLKYGDDIQGSITLNLPPDVLAESVRLVMALSMFISYALQFYVPVEIMWPAMKAKIPTEKMQSICEYAFRTVLVIVTFAMAELIPDLGLFISLVGAVSSSTLALIFPPIISICTDWSEGFGRYNWTLWKNLIVVLFGVLLFTTGSYVSIKNVLQSSDAS